MWGLQDHALDAHNLDELNRFVNDLTTFTIADAGHFIHEDQPEQVTTQLVTWLQRTLRD
jgi:pimeloyl-ACP methyl ester carboxylesterase